MNKTQQDDFKVAQDHKRHWIWDVMWWILIIGAVWVLVTTKWV